QGASPDAAVFATSRDARATRPSARVGEVDAGDGDALAAAAHAGLLACSAGARSWAIGWRRRGREWAEYPRRHTTRADLVRPMPPGAFGRGSTARLFPRLR